MNTYLLYWCRHGAPKYWTGEGLSYHIHEAQPVTDAEAELITWANLDLGLPTLTPYS